MAFSAHFSPKKGRSDGFVTGFSLPHARRKSAEMDEFDGEIAGNRSLPLKKSRTINRNGAA
jgi:hypothetical protein